MKKTKIQVLTYKCSKCSFRKYFLSNEKINTKCKVCGGEMIFEYSRNYNPNEALENVKNARPQVIKNFSQTIIDKPTVTCPYCNSTRISRVGILSRMVSFELWGLASSKIGKQWYCHECDSYF